MFLFFTKLSWSGYWRRHAERFQHWLTVVRDIFSPHLSQGRPENTHTAFKHQETSKHYHLVLSNKVQNYLLLFSCHIFILRDICHIQIYYKLHNFEKAKWILKAFNCCFLQNRFQEFWQFSKCLKISYLRKVKLQNWWLIFLIRILQSLKLLTPLNIIGVVKETAAVNNTILQNKKH